MMVMKMKAIEKIYKGGLLISAKSWKPNEKNVRKPIFQMEAEL